MTVPERQVPKADHPDRERGQLVLLSGLLLATSLVALVLILNSAIYTENLATRNDGAPATDAIEYRENARQGVAGSIEHVNRHARSRNKGNHTDALDESIASWTNRSLQHVALDGHAANVTLNRSTAIEWGTRIGQNADRNFTNANGDPSWEVVGNVSNAVRFRMNVTNESLNGQTNSPFIFWINNSTESHEISVYRSGSSTITVDGGDGFPCSVSGPRAEIDLLNATIENATTQRGCQALKFVDSFDSYQVEYQNADNVSGVYELSTEGDPTQLTGNTNNYSVSSNPYITWAIREATVDVVYESPSLRYESNVTVEPHDPGTIKPTEGTA